MNEYEIGDRVEVLPRGAAGARYGVVVEVVSRGPARYYTVRRREGGRVTLGANDLAPYEPRVYVFVSDGCVVSARATEPGVRVVVGSPDHYIDEYPPEGDVDLTAPPPQVQAEVARAYPHDAVVS